MEKKRQNYYWQFSSNKSYALEITDTEDIVSPPKDAFIYSNKIKYHHCQFTVLPHGKKWFRILNKNPFST